MLMLSVCRWNGPNNPILPTRDIHVLIFNIYEYVILHDKGEIEVASRIKVAPQPDFKLKGLLRTIHMDTQWNHRGP